MADLLDKELHGFHLIDASAGTGKTYTITALVVRLLLEKRLTIQQILVVTYTEAAAADLRIRIRDMLVTARSCFAGHGCGEAFLAELHETIADHARAGRDLACALNDFDEAPIYTIHAFCQRMLRENGLESATLFDVELATDLRDLHWQVVCDYWRLSLVDKKPLFLHYLQGRLNPEKLLELLAKNRPGITLCPQVQGKDNAALYDNFQRLLQEAVAAWPGVATDMAAIFNDEGLKKNVYPLHSRPKWLHDIDAYFRGDLLLPPDCLAKIGRENLQNGFKKGCRPANHPFCSLVDRLWQAWQDLQDSFAEQVLALKVGLFGYADKAIALAKEEQRLLGFDDLLVRLHEALCQEGGARLAGLIRKKYPAALIDEFQDTDPIQFEIFSRIHGRAADHLLYLIGDPKQAIYNFRGADIFAYLAASRQVGSRYSLADNYRSEAGLVAAVNAVFSDECGPPSFVIEDISFEPVSSPGRPLDELVVEEGEQSPLQIMLAGDDEETGQLSAPQSKAVAIRACCTEIRRLLHLARRGRARIGSRELAPGDIAVLVRSNAEARQVQQALAEIGVAGVVKATDLLLASHEARELLRILQAVARPGSEQRLVAALATDILGWSAVPLYRRSEDGAAWDRVLERFERYYLLWRDRGFMPMFQALLAGEEVRQWLLRLHDGERRLTNLLHLGEVLQGQDRRSMHHLMGYLRQGLAGRHGSEHEQRLESDAERLQIVTVHRSKGLQYPLVFCPFLWGGSKMRKHKEFIFHDQQQRLCLDIGSADVAEHLEMARLEELAENLRLAYVALTRARNRCYLLWGPFYGSQESALAYLFHGRADEERAGLLARVKAMTGGQRRRELEALVARSRGNIALVPCPQEVDALPSSGQEEKERLTFTPMPAVIDRSWQVSSFSRLTAGLHQEAFIADRDRSREEVVIAERMEVGRELSIFDFPKGAGPGIFLHHLFEHLDFRAFGSVGHNEVEGWVATRLSRFGYADTWRGPVTAMLAAVTACRLPQRRFCLADLDLEHRLNELEFYLPLAPSRAADLVDVFARHGHAGGQAFVERLRRLDYRLVKGFMKGFIDLVFCHDQQFYIIDWKSNYLGHQLSDYQPRNLEEAMVKADYILQYHLYTVALHRYLANRLADYDYERHFGGVYYVFVRGVDEKEGSGIFFDRPAAELTEDLDNLLVLAEPGPGGLS